MRKSKFDAHLRPFLRIIGMAFGIFRKPAFEHALFLEEHFVDSPQTGEGKTADDGGDNLVFHGQRAAHAQKADDQPYPPALFPPVIFHFNNGRATDADAQEHRCAYDNSIEIHTVHLAVQRSVKQMDYYRPK